MNFRVAAVAVAALVGLTACSASTNGSGQNLRTPGGTSTAARIDSGGPSANNPASATMSPAAGTTDAAYCAKLARFGSRVGELSGGVSDPAKLPALIDQEIAFFNGLKQGAPDEVSAALNDLISVMDTAKKGLADPSHLDPTAVAGLGAKLSQDGRTIATYLAKHCTGS
jgi:hypothetical protein